MGATPPSIVILGSWNPSIIQPAWIATVIDGAENPAAVPVKIGFEIRGGGAPRYSFGDITYLPAQEKLHIYVDRHSDDLFDLAEAKAIKILQTLSHTPVVAFGQNFEFIVDEPDPESLGVFDLNDESLPELLVELEATAQSTSVTTSFKLNSCLLNVTRRYESGKVLYKFNFHYQVTNALQAAERMQNSFKTNSGVVTRILEKYAINRLDLVAEDAA